MVQVIERTEKGWGEFLFRYEELLDQEHWFPLVASASAPHLYQKEFDDIAFLQLLRESRQEFFSHDQPVLPAIFAEENFVLIMPVVSLRSARKSIGP